MIDPKQYDVILISPTMYNTLMVQFKNIAWKRLIFDEPTHTRIPSMKPIIAKFYWFISATPQLLQYNYRYCNFLSFFSYIHASLFNSLIIKNNDDFVKQSFKLPVTNHSYYTCYQPIFNLLKSFISPAISQMISAGNIEGAVRNLGGKECSNLLELVKKRKNESIAECNHRIRIYSQREGDFDTQIKTWKEKKQKYESQLAELDKKFKDILETGTCVICLDKLIKPVLLTCCQNLFCGECILQWLKKKTSCPLCRHTISSDTLVYIKDSVTNKKKLVKPLKTKIQTINDIIKDNNTGKFLIFSAYQDSFLLIREKLKERGISFIENKGSMSNKRTKYQSI